jgi:hypothetical protein
VQAVRWRSTDHRPAAINFGESCAWWGRKTEHSLDLDAPIQIGSFEAFL